MTRADVEDFLNGVPLSTYVMIGVLNFLLFVGGLTFAWWADEYAIPSWNQRSVPSPWVNR